MGDQRLFQRILKRNALSKNIVLGAFSDQELFWDCLGRAVALWDVLGRSEALEFSGALARSLVFWCVLGRSEALLGRFGALWGALWLSMRSI